MQYVRETGKKGYLTYKINGKYLYSSYDPVNEARKFLGSFQNLKKRIITCCGADYINVELLDKNVDEIISIEPVKFDRLTESEKIKRFDEFEGFKKYVENDGDFDYSLILWQSLIESAPDIYLPLLKLIKEFLKKSFYSKIAEKNLSFIETNNILKNVLKLSDFNFISKNQIPKENPAVIISSGFSLYDNLDFLKKIKEHSYFFSLPSSLPFLLSENIIPDYIFAVDPGYATYYHISKYGLPIKLIAPLTIHSSLFNLKNIFPIFFNYCTFLENILYKNSEIAFSQSEGTVFMNLLRILPQLGFRDIVIVGQDFGYKDNRSHIFEGCFEKEFNSISGYFSSLESNIKTIETIKDITHISDGDKMIKTDTSFSIYYNHFISESFKSELFLSENPFNLLMGKYKNISAKCIIDNFPKKKDPDSILTFIINDMKYRIENIFDLLKNSLNTDNSRHRSLLSNLGYDEKNARHKSIIKKYMECIF
jgi:hypothetical protein